jgi:hypothetical protein
MHIRQTLRTFGCLTGGLKRGKQDRDQQSDDANDDKQFDECEAALRIGPMGRADVGHCDTPKCDVKTTDEPAPTNREMKEAQSPSGATRAIDIYLYTTVFAGEQLNILAGIKKTISID